MREKFITQEVKLSIEEWCYKGKTGSGDQGKLQHAENVIH